MAWTLECCKCGTKRTFGDMKDITYVKWRILGWQLHHNGEPLVICPKCEYSSNPETKNTNKPK